MTRDRALAKLADENHLYLDEIRVLLQQADIADTSFLEAGPSHQPGALRDQPSDRDDALTGQLTDSDNAQSQAPHSAPPTNFWCGSS